VDRSWKYINHSHIPECGNWDGGRAIPGKGIHKWDFPCSAISDSPVDRVLIFLRPQDETTEKLEKTFKHVSFHGNNIFTILGGGLLGLNDLSQPSCR
jgi:hypothetical protein